MVSHNKLMQTAARVQSGLLSDKKGQLGNPLKIFIGIAIALVIVVFVVVMGIVMTENLSGQVNSTVASAAADEGTTELSGLLGWVSLVILVMVMVVLIGAIMMIGNISG